MVGHTHEDIDQTFSCLSRYLTKHDALTMSGITDNYWLTHIMLLLIYMEYMYNIAYTPCCGQPISTFVVNFIELEACCKAANHTVRQTSTLKFIFNIKTWISPYLEEIHGHTAPRVSLLSQCRGKSLHVHKNLVSSRMGT